MYHPIICLPRHVYVTHTLVTLARKALGYADDDYTLHHTLAVTEFMTAENHLELLAHCNEVGWSRTVDFVDAWVV